MENPLKNNQKRIEKRALIVTSVANLIMAGAGIWVFVATKIQALFLDGFFSLIGFTSAIFALVISDKSKKKTKSYPNGIYFLEPLYAILKSLLTLILLVVSVVSTAMVAYEYFANGTGNPMNTTPVLPYGIAMMAICFGLGIFNKLQNKKINYLSTILIAESKSNFIDGILSGGVTLGIVILYFIDINGAMGFLHYTGDFFITVILVIFSIKEPVCVLFRSFKELSGATIKDKKIVESITNIIVNKLDGVAKYESCNIFKVGMHIKVNIKINQDINEKLFNELSSIRQSVIDELALTYNGIEIVYEF